MPGGRRADEVPTTTQTAQPTDRGLVTETVAVLGAGGTMGFPVARDIARAGLPTRVWNRASDKAKPLTVGGVRPSPGRTTARRKATARGSTGRVATE
jgi:hypothetical protein